ncbi:hypothetical protein [Alkalihalobacillus sp. AL-G]|uniref:hypothetical protein n=1 Tax=Alkalihalobacillus sp. AL-G TaxID=2926399 RepID=UPI00272BFD67|nr:hypothetical protein [Alkalihalobacillus sp. AL-G]WLD94172.1 hypothetical protein MOJ78_04580 [Alkalihalobacillus sp. AL-G]
MSLLKKADDTTTLSEAKELGKVRSVSNDSIFANSSNEEEIYAEIGDIHGYLNELLGWGAWQAVNPEKMKGELIAKQEYIEEILVPETKGTLRDDLERAADGIGKAIETNDTQDMLITHRIFHDLDVVMNDIVVEDYWGVTETYGSTSP